MADLLIKNLPDKLRRRLQADAKKHRRSMNGEALAMIEKGLHAEAEGGASDKPSDHPFLLTSRWLDVAKRQGQSVRLSEFLAHRK